MKRILFVFVLLCFACKHQKETFLVKVEAINGKHEVKISGIDYAILSEINRDSSKNNWETLAPVYKMPIDTDLKNYQPVQPGIYKIVNQALIFTPDTPFMSTKSYFLRFYQFGDNNSIVDYATGKKKLRALSYRDFVF
jgi:hypothetical protein